jgi:hypothetical protein
LPPFPSAGADPPFEKGGTGGLLGTAGRLVSAKRLLQNVRWPRMRMAAAIRLGPRNIICSKVANETTRKQLNMSNILRHPQIIRAQKLRNSAANPLSLHNEIILK